MSVPPPLLTEEDDTAKLVDGWFSGKCVPIDVRLVEVGKDGKPHYIRSDVFPAVCSALSAAREDGISVHVRSAWRSFEEQKALHDGWTSHRLGFKPADAPGHSAHQEGVAIDFEFATLEQRERFEAIASSHGFVRPHHAEPWHWEVTTDDKEET